MVASSTAALQLLARHVQSDQVVFDRLGPQLTERLSLSLLDLLGCYLASARMGANASIVNIAPRQAPGHGAAAIWGGSGWTTPELAALVNGTVAHHAEFDGGWHGPPRVGVHPAISVLPAAIAVAESCDASGLEFIAAVAAGYDVLAAMARCFSPAIVERTLHPPGLLGSFGAAAAAARLLRLDADATAAALEICAGTSPLCPFESFTAGASAKDLYGGWSCAIGIQAALAGGRSGHEFTLPALLGRTALSCAEIEPCLASPALAEADFKAYPTCRTVHPALTALESLLSHHAVEFDQIAAIRVETYAYAVELDAASDARWPIGARTSVLKCLALRLRFGALQPHHFTEANLALPEVKALCARSRIDVGRYAHSAIRGATVSLVLHNGTCWSFSVESEKWGHAEPASAAQIIEKFHRQSGASLELKDRDELIDRVMDLRRVPSMRFVAEILARSAGQGASNEPARLQPGPSHEGMRAGLYEQRASLLSDLALQGADGELLTQAFAAVDRSSMGLGVEHARRAFTLSLALAPASAGPVPPGWATKFGERIVALANAGFSGPPDVITGTRGLHNLAAAGR